MEDPRYSVGEFVSFVVRTDDDIFKVTGQVFIVDKYGTFEQNDEPSYDIMAPYILNPSQECLYKHYPQSSVFPAKDKALSIHKIEADKL